jgi:hypothetical protein
VAQSGCPILVRAFCAAEPGPPPRPVLARGGGAWDSVAPNQLKAPGAPHPWRWDVGVVQSTTLSPSANNPGAPSWCALFCAAGWDSVAPNQIKAPGAPFWCAALFRAAGWDSVAPNQIKAPGAPHPWCWDVGVVQSTTLLPPRKSIVLACHPEQSEWTSRLLFAPSTTTPSPKHQSWAAG